MKFINISSINRRLDEPDAFVSIAEEDYSAYIEDAAEKILENEEVPIVLLSGPSGSGKTTTAMRIASYIASKGHKAEVLSMDNYFLPINRFTEKSLPRDNEGNVDLESPLRLDIPLFSEHLVKLAKGESVDMPVFDFPTQERSGVIPMKRESGEFLIIEGIHALNPMVTGDADKYCTCIYVSVRTRLRSSTGRMLHPARIRLMRRLCRDGLFRKRTPADVFSMFESVSRGEELYIKPYKNRAHYDIDTFMAYEPSVYRTFILDKLISERDKLEAFPEYDDLITFMKEIDVMDFSHVPANSLVREFVGGSEYDY